MELRELERHWQSLGRRDPLWAILSTPGKRGSSWDEQEFLDTGRPSVELALSRAAAHGLPLRRHRALDFGCGAGRLTQALAAHFDRCDGVDLASSMIAEARRMNRAGDQVRYRHNPLPDLHCFATGSFDFVLSLLVLQHMEPQLMTGYLREFLRVLAVDGAAYFNIPARSVSGQELPREAFAAEIAPPSEPPRFVRGRATSVEVIVRNASPAAWPAAACLNVGNHWRAPDGRMVAMDDVRVPIGSDLAPGDETRVRLELALPGDAPEYMLEIDLVQEHVSWFGDRGSRTLRMPVVSGGNVEPAPAAFRAADETDGFIPRIEMHAMAREEVEATIESAGGTVVAVVSEDFCDPAWPSLVYVVTRRASR